MTALDRAALAAQLAPIRARADAATPGPWEHNDLGGPEWTVWQVGVDPYDSTVAHTELGNDAEFIAAARTDVPALLAIIDRLTDALDVADKAPHNREERCRFGWHKTLPDWSQGEALPCTCWKADYDAAKEAMGHE